MKPLRLIGMSFSAQHNTENDVLRCDYAQRTTVIPYRLASFNDYGISTYLNVN